MIKQRSSRTLIPVLIQAGEGQVDGIESLTAEFKKRLCKTAAHTYLAFTGAGIEFGAGTLVVPKLHDRSGVETYDLSGDDRILALLKTTFSRRVDPTILHTLRRASDLWNEGNKALAQIYLIQAPLPVLKYEHEAYSLFLADYVLRFGYSPQAFCKEPGLELPAAARQSRPMDI